MRIFFLAFSHLFGGSSVQKNDVMMMGETTIKIIVHVTNRLENSCSAGVTIMVAPVA